MNRAKSREHLLQLTYQMNINKENYMETFDSFMENDENKDDIDLSFIKTSLKGIQDNKDAIDEKIELQLVNWKLNRVSKVNLSILRIAIYEIIYKEDIPAKVSINEAIELAKKFSDDKSVSFINGVLDKVYKSL
ncbi:NusB antitermination factor [Clostridium cavendishii DSM 21758]|uniref:Transcription antitermination protein NusB n=1 Tax=Clostridium cavendishii DSM 21758 TaxID=1121302 RepID=A0A1M6KKK2_9CLOT|nr:transcription antitermination factor NusB [Clostridium cavendishii]SHJ59360.1 NusB antitermination factor [Clostridium cavendishii DSM 21758]